MRKFLFDAFIHLVFPLMAYGLGLWTGITTEKKKNQEPIETRYHYQGKLFEIKMDTVEIPEHKNHAVCDSECPLLTK
jgi:hypothetical protein